MRKLITFVNVGIFVTFLATLSFADSFAGEDSLPQDPTVNTGPSPPPLIPVDTETKLNGGKVSPEKNPPEDRAPSVSEGQPNSSESNDPQPEVSPGN